MSSGGSTVGVAELGRGCSGRTVGKPEVMARIGSPGITSAYPVIRQMKNALQNPGLGIGLCYTLGSTNRMLSDSRITCQLDDLRH